MPKGINSTFLYLILKISNPVAPTYFRPITCCNVSYKRMAKILMLRVKEIIDSIVPPSQAAFIPGRDIQDNLLMAHSLIRGYKKRKISIRCSIQVDNQKAYDVVHWRAIDIELVCFWVSSKF